MDIFIDIETIPDQTAEALERIRLGITAPGQYKKPESIAEWLRENADSEAENQWRRTALDGGQGEIVAIGFGFEDEPVEVLHRNLREPESGLLKAFAARVRQEMTDNNESAYGVRFIGHNVGFDLRFLYQRFVVAGVKPGFYLHHDKRLVSDNVFDTMSAWAGYGNRISLDNLCLALGIPSPKDVIDGSRVWDFVKSGRIEEVAAYCKRDVETVRTIHERMCFRGVVA
jgi:3'-5' exonuclease